MRKYRYFYHYFKQMNKGSVHYRGKCTTVDKIVDGAVSESHAQNTQPRWVMRGFGNVEIKKTKDGLTAFIS